MEGVLIIMAKISVIGAGQVGATLAYTLAISGTATELVLVDIDFDKATGEMLDISHGLQFIAPVTLSSGDYELIRGSDIVAVTAGAPQKDGEGRRSLLTHNSAILADVCENVVRYAPECVLLIITNPVDALTYEAINLTDMPVGKVIGSGTVLDTSRFRAMLSEHTGVDARNIHAYVLGEHGESEVPAWSMINIAGMGVGEYCRTCGGCADSIDSQLNETFNEKVRNVAQTIIEKKSATYYGIALASRRIIEAVLRDENSILTVSALANGEYGISDVCLSLPRIIGRGGVVKTLNITLNAEEKLLLNNSADIIRSMQSVNRVFA